MKKIRMTNYAKVIARIAANIQQGQKVIIYGNTENSEFVNILSEEAYKLGAREVEVVWEENNLRTKKYKNENLETLSTIPKWKKSKMKDDLQGGAAIIHLETIRPLFLEEMAKEKFEISQKKLKEKLKKLRKSYSRGRNPQEVSVLVADQQTAKDMFPKKQDSLSSLWKFIFDELFISTRETDDWYDKVSSFLNTLRENSNKLNEFPIEKMQFLFLYECNEKFSFDFGPLNDWKVEKEKTKEGITFIPRINSLGVASVPINTNGTFSLYLKDAVYVYGKKIENGWIKFNNGKLVSFDVEGTEEKRALEKFLKKENNQKISKIKLKFEKKKVSGEEIVLLSDVILTLGGNSKQFIRGNKTMSKRKLKKNGWNPSEESLDFSIWSGGISVNVKFRETEEKKEDMTVLAENGVSYIDNWER